jgi:ribosome-associated heat shock protein Hsp15
MRIDKYLWCVLLQDQNMVTGGDVKNMSPCGNNVAKLLKEVFPTDKITFRKDQNNRS